MNEAAEPLKHTMEQGGWISAIDNQYLEHELHVQRGDTIEWSETDELIQRREGQEIDRAKVRPPQ